MKMNAFLFALLGLVFWGIAPIFGKIGLVDVAPGIALFMRSSIITVILLVWLLASGQAPCLAGVARAAGCLSGWRESVPPCWDTWRIIMP